MRLTRQRRMRQWGEFHTVRQKGQSSGGKFVVLGAHGDPSITEVRFGLITSKRVGNAVTRNLLRRRFREIIRKHGDHLPEKHRIVTVARWRAAQASFQELAADWLKTARRLKIWQEEPANPS